MAAAEGEGLVTADPGAETFDQHCIVEMMGHRRLAGRVREVQVAGAGFLRLDVPPAGDDPGRTQYLSPGSVYALHPVDEASAAAAAAEFRAVPVSRWDMRRALALPGDDDTWGPE
jgi:hypothetical protein